MIRIKDGAKRVALWTAMLAAVAMLSGCLDTSSAGADPGANELASQESFLVANSAPVIDGAPISTASIGNAYSFTPRATDADGDAMTFSIRNKPDWATFNTATGQLQGTPTADSAGSYSVVGISVSDGKAKVAIAFTISVGGSGDGVASLSWSSPTINTDGTALTDLAGYTVHYGADDSMAQSVPLDSATNAFSMGNLTAGTWYFAVKSVNSAGVESSMTPMVSKTIT